MSTEKTGYELPGNCGKVGGGEPGVLVLYLRSVRQ